MLKKGQKVRFTGSSHAQENFTGTPCPPFLVGTVHVVEEVEDLGFRSRISLVGYKGKFNSVSFEPVA